MKTLDDVPYIETDEDAERLFGPWARGLVSAMNEKYPPRPIHVIRIPQDERPAEEWRSE